MKKRTFKAITILFMLLPIAVGYVCFSLTYGYNALKYPVLNQMTLVSMAVVGLVCSFAWVETNNEYERTLRPEKPFATPDNKMQLKVYLAQSLTQLRDSRYNLKKKFIQMKKWNGRKVSYARGLCYYDGRIDATREIYNNL